MPSSTRPNALHNCIDELFERCRAENRAALVLYITAGFPSAEVTRRVLPVLAESGADLIELGIPFSDPIADGPIIQHSSTVALQNGMTFPGTLEILRDFKAKHQTPTIVFGALNPYLVRGLPNSARMTRDAGGAGILAADLPFEEAEEFRALLTSEGLHLITLIAPTTPTPRIRQIASQSTGFLYCIAMKGTTGTTSGLQSGVTDYVNRVRSVTSLPIALGFGISKPEHVKEVTATGADAVVVGSSLIKLIEETLTARGDLEKTVGDYVRSLAAELKR